MDRTSRPCQGVLWQAIGGITLHLQLCPSARHQSCQGRMSRRFAGARFWPRAPGSGVTTIRAFARLRLLRQPHQTNRQGSGAGVFTELKPHGATNTGPPILLRERGRLTRRPAGHLAENEPQGSAGSSRQRTARALPTRSGPLSRQHKIWQDRAHQPSVTRTGAEIPCRWSLGLLAEAVVNCRQLRW